ncbi:MAG: biopolymer transporter ExbD [Proteobacteria bacterium]|nr:biopolymer transporter ExbD [Pseudomonadota bacterium]
MAKKAVKIEDAEELSLTPIMNIVLVLIPLMLLSVVFMTIAVIEVTMPQRSAGSATNGEPPKRLQLYISQKGFTVVEGQATLPAIEGCPPGGATICTIKDEIDPEREVETDRYKWLELYNQLMEIKLKPDWADHDQIEIIPDSSVSFGVLVKAMDISHNQRVPRSEFDTAIKGKKLADVKELNDSLAPLVDVTIDGETGKAPLGMFPVVVLGLPTLTN